MSEVKQGELYKYVSNGHFMVGIKGKWLTDVEINAVLDEARAEFPKYPNIADYPKGGDDWLNALDKYDHEVEVWRKKWFGSL